MDHLCIWLENWDLLSNLGFNIFVKAPLEPRKVIRLLLYWYAHGVSANIIVDKFNVEVFTMSKYVDIIVNVLIYKDKLFSWYIFISHGPHLLRIMDGFFHACGLPNVFGTIDGSSLSQKPINKLLQYLQIIIVDGKVVIQLFWNVCCSIPGGTTYGG